MTSDDRIRELHDRAVRELVEAHSKRTDEPLILAVRYRLDEPLDVYLLEVLRGFPGGDDDQLLSTAYEPSAQLRILGKLHLVLGSPAQLRAAIARKDPTIGAARQGRAAYDDGSSDAAELKRALGL